MPLIIPWFGKQAATAEQAPNQKGKLGGTVPTVVRQGQQVTGIPRTPIADPRQARGTIPANVMDVVTARIGAETVALGSSLLGPVNTRAIPNMHDAIQIDLTVSGTESSGASGAGSIQLTTALAQVNIRTPDGSVIMSFLSEHFHSYFERFSKWTTDFTDPSTTVGVNDSLKSLGTTVIRIPVRLPAKYGPYQIDIIYSNLAGLGVWGTNNGPVKTAATNVTVANITTQMDVLYGDAQGYESHLVPATFGGLAAGVNELAQNFPVKNKAIGELCLYSFAADSDLDRIVLLTNGQAIEPHLINAMLAARDAMEIQATRPTVANGNVFWLHATSQFSINPTSQFQVFLVTGATTTSIKAWVYYLEPAA